MIVLITFKSSIIPNLLMGCNDGNDRDLPINKKYILKKSIVYTLISIITFTSASSLSFSQVCNLSSLPTNLQNGLIAFYPFCGNANDVSGNQLNGAIFGATLTSDRFGVANSAFEFNGSSWIEVDHNPAFNFGLGSYTLSCWMLVTGSNRWQHAITHYDIPSNRYVEDLSSIFLRYENSMPHFATQKSRVSMFEMRGPVANISVWRHILLVYNTSSAEAQLYTDGKLVSSKSIPKPFINSDNQGKLYFGVEHPTVTLPLGPQFLTGKLDDIMIYNRPLSASEVSQIYCNSVNNQSFSINPFPDSLSICGSSISLNAGSGFTSYSWNTGATSQSLSPMESGKYRVSVTNLNGCSASDSTYLSIVNAKIIQSDTTICKGSNITLAVNLKPNQSASWSTGATTPSITVNPTVKTTYTVTVTDGITTCTDNIVVDVSSSELKVTDPTAVCSPGVVNLTAAAITSGSATGLTYTYWKDAIATQALANPDKVSVSGTYYIVGTSSTGCTSAPTAVKVTVNPLTIATIIAPSQTAICDKSSITLTATGGTAYQWLLNGSEIFGAINSSYAATQAGSYEVNVISNGCKSKVAAPVNLTLIKAAIPKYGNSSTCIDVPVSFFNETDTTLSGAVSWLWDFGDGQTSTLLNPVYTYKKSGAYIVKLTVTPKLCNSLSVSFTKNITVDIPPVGIKYPNVLAVKNKATQLSARFIANGYTYLWMPSTGLNNGALQKPIFNESNEQLYRIRLTSASGCITMDTVKVSVYDSSDIFVPKAFSPNKDGKNDLLQPFLVNITTLKFFRVYNRWGQLMFQSSDSKQGWDGMYNYKPQPLETYTWIAEGIDGNGTTIFRKGQTVLIR